MPHLLRPVANPPVAVCAAIHLLDRRWQALRQEGQNVPGQHRERAGIDLACDAVAPRKEGSKGSQLLRAELRPSCIPLELLQVVRVAEHGLLVPLQAQLPRALEAHAKSALQATANRFSPPQAQGKGCIR